MFDIKNLFEIEADLNTRKSDITFCSDITFGNRSIPVFAIEIHKSKPKEKRLIKVKVLYVEELLGLVRIKIFDTVSIITLKVKIFRNEALLNVVNTSNKDFEFSPSDAIRIFVARSISYYIIDHKVIQQNLSSYQLYQL